MTQATNPIVRTSSGLTNAMFDELDEIRAGRSTPQRASAIANLAARIVSIAQLEVGYQRFVRTTVAADGEAVRLMPIEFSNRRVA